MKKNFLLAAASFAVLTAATAAGAGEVTVSVGLVDVTAADPYTLATELSADLEGVVDFTVTFNDPLPSSDNLKLTFRLADGATFVDGVVSTDLDGFDQVVISEGGTPGSTSVTFLVSNPTAPTVDTVATLSVNVEVQSGETPSIEVLTTTENNTPIEGGTTGELTFIDYDSIIALSTTPAADSILTIDSGFTEFRGGAEASSLGTFTVAFADDVFIDLAGNEADAGDFVDADLTVIGSSTNIDYTVTPGASSEVDGDTITITEPGTYTVTANLDGDPANTSSYRVVANSIDIGGNFEVGTDLAVGALGDIVREGTSVIVPWVASASLGSANSTRNVIRVSNTGAEPTGLVYVELLAQNGAQGVPATGTIDEVVSLGVTVPANSDLQITSQQLEGALGDFRRGDVRVTVEGDADALIFRSRLTQPGGAVEEITLEPEVGPLEL